MKKRILSLVLALCMTAALCACGGGKSNTPKPANNPDGSAGVMVEGGEITVAIAADLDTSLDPHVSSSSAGTREVLFNIYEGLVKPDANGNLIPAVAEKYTVNETADQLPFLPEAHRAYGNEVRQEGKTVANEKNAKQNWFKRAWKAVSNWFRGMKSELKKVVWPSRKTTTKNVLVAVTVMVISGVVIWAFDQVAMLVVQTLISIGH